MIFLCHCSFDLLASLMNDNVMLKLCLQCSFRVVSEIIFSC